MKDIVTSSFIVALESIKVSTDIMLINMHETVRFLLKSQACTAESMYKVKVVPSRSLPLLYTLRAALQLHDS